MRNFALLTLVCTFTAAAGCGNKTTGTTDDLGTGNLDQGASADLTASSNGDMAQGGVSDMAVGPSGPDFAGVDLAGLAPVSGTMSLQTSTSAAVVGATVEVVGASPANTTTTDSTGNFTILVAADVDQTVRFTSTGNVTIQIVVHIGAGGSGTLSINTQTQTDFASEAGTLDPTKGNLIAFFNGLGGTTPAGYGLTLSQAHASAFTQSGTGTVTASDTTLASGFPFVTYVNVTAGTTTATVVKPTGSGACTPPFPVTNYPIDANVLTAIIYNCM